MKKKANVARMISVLLLFALLASCSTMSHQEKLQQEYGAIGTEYNELARKYYDFQVSPDRISDFIAKCEEFVAKCEAEDYYYASSVNANKAKAQIWRDETKGWVRFCSNKGINWNNGGFARFLASIADSPDGASYGDLYLIARAKSQSGSSYYGGAFESVIGKGWTSYAKEQERIRQEQERLRRESEAMIEQETAKTNEMIANLEKSGSADDAYELVRLYREGKSITTPDLRTVVLIDADADKAESYLKRAADLGSADAVLELIGSFDMDSYPSNEQISLMNRVVRFSDADKHKCPVDFAMIVAFLLNCKVLDPASGDKDKEFRDWFILAAELTAGEAGEDNARNMLDEIDKLERNVRESNFKQGTAFEKLMEKYKDMFYFDRLYKSVSDITDTGTGCYYMAFIKANGITSDGKYTNDGDIYSAADYFHNARYYKSKKAAETVDDINKLRHAGDGFSSQVSNWRDFFDSVMMAFYAGDIEGSFDSKMDQMCASSLKICDNPRVKMKEYMDTEEFWRKAGFGLHINIFGGYKNFLRAIGWGL